jgi:soluble lytic murein transglycosylase-like protein
VVTWSAEISSAIARWAPHYGVTIPAQLVRAVIDVESKGDPEAIRRERDGELSLGLMQVKESTARDLGVAPATLLSPAIGISTGVRYLAIQLARYGGQVRDAIAAYNAGSVRRRSSGQYVNQGYVDDVWRAFTGAGGVAAYLLAGAAVYVLAAAAVRSRGGRRGW